MNDLGGGVPTISAGIAGFVAGASARAWPAVKSATATSAKGTDRSMLCFPPKNVRPISGRPKCQRASYRIPSDVPGHSDHEAAGVGAGGAGKWQVMT